jgi:predicted P-loop ATPase
MLILAGERQGTGKTEAFRRLLPKELKPYYAEISAGMKETDFNIMLAQKLIVMDDECGGKSKKDAIHIKSMLSKNTFTLREPYGKMNIDLKRLAVLCGTTNDLAILNDPTGNRRLLPMEIISIDFSHYNSINKEHLFLEAYHLFKNGFEWQLSYSDCEKLYNKTSKFEDYSMEYELIQKYLQFPETSYYSQEMSATEIKILLENKSGQKTTSLKRIGMELKRLGYHSKMVRINGKVMQVYSVIEKPNNVFPVIPGSDEKPF